MFTLYWFKLLGMLILSFNDFKKEIFRHKKGLLRELFV